MSVWTLEHTACSVALDEYSSAEINCSYLMQCVMGDHLRLSWGILGVLGAGDESVCCGGFLVQL